MVERRLGRGLDFFLSGSRGSAPAPAPVGAQPAPGSPAKPAPTGLEAEAEPSSSSVPIASLVPSPFQPRRDMGQAELAALADSIKASGILQPILARKVGDQLEIVAGERRWRAAQLAGLQEVPVLIKKITDDESAVFGLVENIQREDLNAIDKAKAFAMLIQKLGTTQEELARRVGVDRSTLANFVRLLDLPEPIQAHVSRGTLSMGHARAILGLMDRDAMPKLAEECIRNAWSVRALEQQVKDINTTLANPKGPKVGGPKKTKPAWLTEVEESLVEALSTKVSVRYGRKRSQILIECAGRDEFERVLKRLRD